MYPHVTILIPTKNVVNYVDDVIQSLLNLDYPEESIDIVILDAYSTDGTIEALSKYPVKIIQENCNPPTAYNPMIEQVKGGVIAFGDGDAIVDKNWLKSLVRHLDDPEIAGVGGLCSTANDDKLIPRIIGYELQDRYERMPENISRIATMNVIFKKTALQEVGGFDEELDTSYDAEVGHKITRSGYNIRFDKEAIVYHHHRSDLVSFFKQQYTYGTNIPKMYLKNWDMAKGDEVTSLWMNLQPFLFTLIGILLLTSPFLKRSLILATGLIIVIGSIYFASAVRLSYKFKDLAALFLVVIYLTRSIAWTFGGVRCTLTLIKNKFGKMVQSIDLRGGVV
ncbi:MAG: glycosyltransferase [Halobacteriota archaeon]|nr:glycosyltransferase [Halobacteriota archaeon]